MRCAQSFPEAEMMTGYAPERIEYGVNRYQNETRRLYRVMDTQLAKTKKFLVPGDKLTIADISCWGWVASHSQFEPPFFSLWCM